MTKTDLIKLEEALVMVKEMGIVKPRAKVGIHSPWIEQYFAMKKAFGDVVEVMTKDVWDIEDRKLTMAYDLLVFCNVFMYTDQPAVAFANVLESCKLLLVQDIIKRDRDPIFLEATAIVCGMSTANGMKRNRITRSRITRRRLT